MEDDRLYDIALTLVPGLGCKSLRRLYDIVPQARDVFAMSAAELRQLFGHRHLDIADAVASKSTMARAEAELRFAERKGIQVLFYQSENYPMRLNRSQCEDTPTVLYYKGTASLNSARVVSVVGTRRATDYGRTQTQRLVQGLNQQGLLVVSGLALGIDAAAHKASVEFGVPTVGVVAHGFDHFYPPQNRKLAQQMLAQGGGMVTEYASGTPILAGMFPARNRIIAAMADVVVVVESGIKGGALITANLANGYQRDVMAFPGRVGDKYSEGCNRIISSQRAALIQGADDLMALMGWDYPTAKKATQQELLPPMTSQETELYNLLIKHGAMTIEEILPHTTFSLPELSSLLLNMELKGICRCLPGKVYKI